MNEMCHASVQGGEVRLSELDKLKLTEAIFKSFPTDITHKDAIVQNLLSPLTAL